LPVVQPPKLAIKHHLFGLGLCSCVIIGVLGWLKRILDSLGWCIRANAVEQIRLVVQECHRLTGAITRTGKHVMHWAIARSQGSDVIHRGVRRVQFSSMPVAEQLPRDSPDLLLHGRLVSTPMR